MYNLGDGYEGFLLHQIKNRGAIEYHFIFSVFKDKTPYLFYCAESHAENESVYLGVFDEVGHKNLGVDNQCNDSMVFLMKALEYVCEKLSLTREGIEEVPQQAK